MTSSFEGLTVIGPSANWVVIDYFFFSREKGVKNGGTWNAFYNGNLIKKWTGN
jgi:hypothetical protein